MRAPKRAITEHSQFDPETAPRHCLRLSSWFLAACLALGASSSSQLSAQTSFSSGQDQQESATPTQASFDLGVAELQELLTRRRWSKAIRALNDLLEEHAGAEYVLPHLQGFREELRRASFWKEMKELAPKDLIAGKLLRYGASTGSVKVSYDLNSLGDFENYGDGVVHPMHLRSPWSVTIEGTAEELARRTYFFEAGLGDGYSVTLGSWVKGARMRFDHLVMIHTKGVPKELETIIPKELPATEKKIKAKFRVTDREFRVSYDGKTLFTQKLRGEKLSRLALVRRSGDNGTEFGEMTIEGRIDPGWISGVLDAVVSKQRTSFNLSWKDPDVFDAWELNEELRRVDFGLVQLLERLVILTRFENTTEQALYHTFASEFGKGRGAAAQSMKRLTELPEGTLTESAATNLLFNFALELGYYNLALLAFARLEIPAESSLEQAILSADLNLRAGKKEQAEAKFRLLASELPLISFVHQRHAEILLLMGKADEAQLAITQGQSALPFSKELRDLELKIIKATKGPAWERVYENRGQHFLVRTDLDRKAALEARRVVDEAWERCADFFGPLEEVPTPLPADPEERKANCHSIVYLFAGEAGYLDFVNGIADDSLENTLGIYNKYLKHIAAWNQPSKADLWQTLRHEVAHRYLDLAIGERIPRWLNEGLAEHFAASWLIPKKKRDPNPGRLALGEALTGKKLPHVFQFMQYSEEEFMRDPQLGYAMAWAVVHIWHGEKETTFIRRLLATLRTGEDPNSALDQRLAEYDPTKMNAFFTSAVKALELLLLVQPVTSKYGR